MTDKEKLEYLHTESAKLIEKLSSDKCTSEDEFQIMKDVILFDMSEVNDDSLIRSCLSLLLNKYYGKGFSSGVKQKEQDIKELLYKKHVG
jgi:hypothetical protein